MGFKQPRVPEYREGEGVSKHLKALTLFLKDFCAETWTAHKSLRRIVDTASASDETESGMFAFDIDERGHLICAYETAQPPPLSIDENGHLIWTVDSQYTVDLGRVISEGGEGMDFDIDETLMFENGRLSVNTADAVEKDNTLPITSAAVHTTVGNIEVLLQTI